MCLFRQDGSSKGYVVSSICLRNDGLKAKLAFVMFEKIPAFNMSSLGVIIAPHQSEWAIVVKWRKWVPLPKFYPSLPCSPKELRWTGWGVFVLIRGKMLFPLR